MRQRLALLTLASAFAVPFFAGSTDPPDLVLPKLASVLTIVGGRVVFRDPAIQEHP